MEKKKKIQIPVIENFFDTHVHLDLLFDMLMYKPDDLEKFITNEILGNHIKIKNDNFIGLLNISCFPDYIDFNETLIKVVQSSEEMKKKIFFSFGCHPHSASHYNDDYENRLVTLMSENNVIAWGECGLDYFKLLSPKESQIEAFRRQLTKAVELNKTIVIHSRSAEEDTMAIMKELIPKDHYIHLHCFTGSLEFAKDLLEYFPNLFIGFTGCISFKNSVNEQNVVREIPIERLLIETDGPFMAPEPLRGQTCHSGMIPFVVENVAKIKNLDVKEIYKLTLENARTIYKLK
jgi:TatD DNase family protein